MGWLRRWVARLGRSGRYEPLRREIDEELRFHLERRIEVNISRGMSPEAARADALRRLGDTEEIRREGAWLLSGRRSALGSLLEDALKDTGHGLRRLRHRPGLAFVSMGILALGLSASTAVFTYINTFFQPFPGAAADDALKVHRATEDAPFGALSYPDFLALQELDGEAFAGVEGVRGGFAASARHETLTEVVFGEAVTGDFFSLLEVAVHRGRGLSAEDDRPDAPPAVVLSHAYWMDRYAGDSDALGRTLFLNNNPYTIVGVAGPGFIGTSAAMQPEVWITFEEYKRVYWARDDRATNPNAPALTPLVKLAPGVGRAQAAGAVTALAAGLDQTAPLEEGLRRLFLDPATWIDPSARQSELPTARIMFAAAAGLLLLACVNVANLMLAVGSRREREMAMRAAIGASRGRLARQLLTESLFMGLGAGLLALVLVGPASNWIGSFFARPSVWGANVPRAVHVDPNVFLFALAAAVLTGLAAGVLPALRASRREVVGALKESPGAGSPSRFPGVRDLLVSAQIALSLTLLVVAALVLRTLDAAASTDPGFRTEDVLASYISTSSMGTPIEERHRFYQELSERLEALPWVSAATVADYAPLSPHGTAEVRLDAEGATAPVKVAKVFPGYFEALDIPLLAGRTFQSTDTAASASVVVIDKVMAQRLFGAANALGRQITWTAPIVEGERTSVVVGVVENSRMETLLGETEAHLYLSYPQVYSTPGNAVMIVTPLDPAAAVRLLEAEYRAVDTRLAVVNVLPYREVVGGFVYTQRMNAELFSAVALLGLLLAAVGIFGVMNLAVGLRTREIGIRLAIGAGSMDITRVVARRAILSVALGLLLGLGGAALSVRWVESLLLGVEAMDPVSFSVAAGVLTAAALLAAWLPTRRALRVDPMGSLRVE